MNVNRNSEDKIATEHLSTIPWKLISNKWEEAKSMSLYILFSGRNLESIRPLLLETESLSILLVNGRENQLPKLEALDADETINISFFT